MSAEAIDLVKILAFGPKRSGAMAPDLVWEARRLAGVLQEDKQND